MRKKVRKTINVKSSLESKGFIRRKGRTHHDFYHLYFKGKKTTIFTKCSRSHHSINIQNLKKMARQLRLNDQDFDDLIDCPMTRENYLEKMLNGGFI